MIFRFADESKINKLAYMPFGIGSRICIGVSSFIKLIIQSFSNKHNFFKGKKFAQMELKLTLAKILSKYDVYPAKPNPEELAIRDGTFTVRRPKDGISVVFKKRY